MRIHGRTAGDAVVYSLDGALTGGASGHSLSHAVNVAVLDGRRGIVVDLSAVSLVDAGGLGALVSAYHTTVASGAPLCLARVPARVRQLLAITKLTTFLTVCDSLEEALDSCASASPIAIATAS